MRLLTWRKIDDLGAETGSPPLAKFNNERDNPAERFGAINAMLHRNHMVTTLCVLDAGTAWYSVESGSTYDADFMRDRGQQLLLQVNAMEPDYAFYRWYVLLASHLTRSILGFSNVFHAYGNPPPPRSTRCYPEAAFNKR